MKKKIKGKNLTYLDSANSSQKPKSVIDKMNEFYSYEFANVGRGIYQLASNASEKYEETRQELKNLLTVKMMEKSFLQRTQQVIKFNRSLFWRKIYQ